MKKFPKQKWIINPKLTIGFTVNTKSGERSITEIDSERYGYLSMIEDAARSRSIPLIDLVLKTYDEWKRT